MTSETRPGEPPEPARADLAPLEERLTLQSRRLARAEVERRRPLASLIASGTVGVLFALPVIGGAYLGSWLDGRLHGYSVHWTLMLICIGVGVGATNVYLFLKN